MFLPSHPPTKTQNKILGIKLGKKRQALLETFSKHDEKQPLTASTDNEDSKGYCRAVFGLLAQIELKVIDTYSIISKRGCFLLISI